MSGYITGCSLLSEWQSRRGYRSTRKLIQYYAIPDISMSIDAPLGKPIIISLNICKHSNALRAANAIQRATADRFIV